MEGDRITRAVPFPDRSAALEFFGDHGLDFTEERLQGV